VDFADSDGSEHVEAFKISFREMFWVALTFELFFVDRVDFICNISFLSSTFPLEDGFALRASLSLIIICLEVFGILSSLEAAIAHCCNTIFVLLFFFKLEVLTTCGFEYIFVFLVRTVKFSFVGAWLDDDFK
jgi:hypothetical protein